MLGVYLGNSDVQVNYQRTDPTLSIGEQYFFIVQLVCTSKYPSEVKMALLLQICPH